MPNGKGFYDMQQPMKKTQPGIPGGHNFTGKENGHDFNTKAKVTNPGNGYNNVGAGAGAGFNGAEKDASIKYLTERGQKGQVVNQFTATHRTSKDHTQNVGTTAFNSRPIAQVYKPATSNGAPSQDQIVYKTKTKDVLNG